MQSESHTESVINPRRAGLRVNDPCSPIGWNVVQTWIRQKAMLISYLASLGDTTPTEITLKDKHGNTKIIDPMIDYTLADLYDASGALLP